MKITKDQLKKIIKEELQLAEEEDATKTKAAFSQKLLQLSKEVRDVDGLDGVEIQRILRVTVALIQFAGSEQGANQLKQIEDIIAKRIGESKND
jgi:hypothetical protein